MSITSACLFVPDSPRFGVRGSEGGQVTQRRGQVQRDAWPGKQRWRAASGRLKGEEGGMRTTRVTQLLSLYHVSVCYLSCFRYYVVVYVCMNGEEYERSVYGGQRGVACLVYLTVG